jgi:PEP-CTERM motif
MALWNEGATQGSGLGTRRPLAAIRESSFTMALKFITPAIVGLALAAQAHSAVIGTLTFDQPTGTVNSNQSIPIYLTLTLDPASDALSSDASSHVTSGFDSVGYAGPVDLTDPATSIFFNESFQCSGTFTSGCGAGAYAFNFNYSSPAFIAPSNFSLLPGQSYSWLFGSFSPVGGNAPGGTYTFYNASAMVELYNPNGAPNAQFDFITLASTCPGQTADCAFTRDVNYVSVGVPEPASWAMMILGVGLLGGAVRQRRRVQA